MKNIILLFALLISFNLQAQSHYNQGTPPLGITFEGYTQIGAIVTKTHVGDAVGPRLTLGGMIYSTDPNEADWVMAGDLFYHNMYARNMNGNTENDFIGATAGIGLKRSKSMFFTVNGLYVQQMIPKARVNENAHNASFGMSAKALIKILPIGERLYLGFSGEIGRFFTDISFDDNATDGSTFVSGSLSFFWTLY